MADFIAFQLPEDGALAEQALLDIVANPDKTYIDAFDFSLSSLFTEIEKADANGVSGEILIDRRESGKPAQKARISVLSRTLKNWRITIGSAAYGKTPSQINHSKTVVTESSTGLPWCWTGSTNITDVAFNEENSVYVFRSKQFSDMFIAHLMDHIEWNRKNHPTWQIQ